jgi:hypothetical protein
MRTVVCVLKTGKWKAHQREISYSDRHVRWLQKQVQKYAPGAPFVCLSDIAIPGVDTIPLKHGWPGWWSKIELFRLDIGPVLYLDLDMVITGPLDDLMNYPHEFTAWENVSKAGGAINSSVMAWSGPHASIYDPFAANPKRWMAECVTKKCWGDQGFIERHVGQWQGWQSMFPGAVVSYKHHILRQRRNDPKREMRLVSFHGKPKPWEVKRSWVPCLN